MSSDTLPLSSFLKLKKGLSYKGDYLDQTGPPLIGIGSVLEGGGFRDHKLRMYSGPYKDDHKIAEGDVFVAMTNMAEETSRFLGSVAKLPQIPSGCGILTHHVSKVVWKTTDPILRDFLYWMMRCSQFQLHCRYFGTGTTVYAVKGKDVERYLVNSYPTEEQQALVHVLNQLSNLQQEVHSMLERLEEQIGGLFLSWFIDFDAVKAKAEGKLLYGLDDETAALFPDSFENSEIGPIPTGWRVGMMEDVLSQKQDSTTPGEHLSTRHYVPIDNIDSKSLTLKNWLPYTDAASSLILFSKNDLLFGAMRPYFHKVTIAPFDGITRSTCFVFVPKVQGTLGFSLCLLNLDSTIRYATDSSLGSTMPYATWKKGLARHKTVLPPPKIMVAFSNAIAPHIEKIRDGGVMIRSLSSTRDALLLRMMSGEPKRAEVIT